MKSLFAPATFVSRCLQAAVLGTVLAVGFPGSAAAEVFEGRIQLKMTLGSAPQTTDCLVKKGRLRVSSSTLAAQGGSMIVDMKEKKIFMLMPAQKMFITMPLSQLEGIESEGNKPVPTGETQTILGYKTEKYRFPDAENFEVWATDELGTFGGLFMLGAKSDPASPADKALADQKFFPLLVIDHSTGNRFEVTKIEREELEDSLFQPPSDFMEMQVPAQMPR